MAEVIWTDLALEDIDSIADYISRDSLTFASIQAERFFERAKILETQPSSGRVVPELNVTSVRELVMENYRIVYSLEFNDQVTILTVHHAKKLLKNNPAIKKIRKRR